MKLTERDIEVLNELDYTNHGGDFPLTWARPLDVGGSNGSDHSYRLSKMAKHGFVEARQRMPWMSRGSKVYRITPVGRQALATARAADEGEGR